MKELVLEALYGVEPNMDNRINQAKEKANRILMGRGQNEEEMQLSLRYVLSKHYHIPLYDNYFNQLTLDQLILEVTLVSSQYKTTVQGKSDLVNAHKEEADALFDDMAAEAEQEWQDITNTESNIDWDEEMARFMATSQFKGNV